MESSTQSGNKEVTNFLKAFFKAPKGNTPEAIKARIEHWIAVLVTPPDIAHNAHKRKLATQNLRRLCNKYPEIVEQMLDSCDSCASSKEAA